MHFQLSQHEMNIEIIDELVTELHHKDLLESCRNRVDNYSCIQVSILPILFDEGNEAHFTLSLFTRVKMIIYSYAE